MTVSNVRIVDTRDEPLKGAMMVVGFPTHGLVGSVAASYLVHSLDMTLVAYMTSEEFPPTVIMEEGIVARRSASTQASWSAASTARATNCWSCSRTSSPRRPC